MIDAIHSEADGNEEPHRVMAGPSSRYSLIASPSSAAAVGRGSTLSPIFLASLEIASAVEASVVLVASYCTGMVPVNPLAATLAFAPAGSKAHTGPQASSRWAPTESGISDRAALLEPRKRFFEIPSRLITMENASRTSLGYVVCR